MKCPRCGRDMIRRRTKDKTFEYKCPICGLVIGANRKTEEQKEEPKE